MVVHLATIVQRNRRRRHQKYDTATVLASLQRILILVSPPLLRRAIEQVLAFTISSTLWLSYCLDTAGDMTDVIAFGMR